MHLLNLWGKVSYKIIKWARRVPSTVYYVKCSTCWCYTASGECAECVNNIKVTRRDACPLCGCENFNIVSSKQKKSWIFVNFNFNPFFPEKQTNCCIIGWLLMHNISGKCLFIILCILYNTLVHIRETNCVL